MTTRSRSEMYSESEPSADNFDFFVVGTTSSSVVPLPPVGFLLIGRGPDADIRLEDSSVSRKHARLFLDHGVRIADLDSRNGVRINGVPLAGARALVPGDVVAIGSVLLTLRRHPKIGAAPVLLSEGEILARFERELERANERSEPITVIVLGERASGEPVATSPPSRPEPLDHRTIAQALERDVRTIDTIGRTPDGSVVVLLPGVDARESGRRAAVLASRLSKYLRASCAGSATSGVDGVDARTLLAAARRASRKLAPNSGGDDAEPIVTLTIGDRPVVLADPTMIRLCSLIERLAVADLPILVAGETGVGKEHVAMAVHHWSARKSGPFVSVNCAAIPDALVESEFFGYEKGAFSGAHTSKVGLFERAARGTLFLDEVGELSLSAQAKLLRVLEDGSFARLGDTKTRRADVRVVAATNRDLAKDVAARRFREDLFYRLNVAVVLIPPLRERPADILALSRSFLGRARERLGRSELSLAPSAVEALSCYRWPGNVRELRNAMEYVAASAGEGAVERSSLPEAIARGPEQCTSESESSPEPGERARAGNAPEVPSLFRPISVELEELERQRMREALVAAGGVKLHAAKLISMPERTFRVKFRQYGLEQTTPDDE